MKRALKTALPTLACLLCLVALALGLNAAVAARAESIGDGDDPEGPASPADARPLPVETIRLTPVTEVEITRRFTGEVRARRTTDLSFEGSGRIAELLVDEGDKVARGQVLGSLDVAVLSAQKAEIESRRFRLEAQLAELLKGPRAETIDAARAGVAAAQEELDLATVLRDRRKELAERGTISPEQLDTTAAQVKTLAASLSAAKARLAELENGTREETIQAQRGALLEVDAAAAYVDAVIEQTTLRAPFAGTIAVRFLDEGTVVSQQMPSAALRLVETDALEAYVGVPRDLALEDLQGAGATLRVAGQDLTATRVRTLPSVDESTRTVAVIFDLDAETSRGAKPGDLVSLTVQTSRKQEGAWIPLSALREGPRGLWSAYAVTEPNGGDSPQRVEQISLEVLTTRDGRAFVRGTFDAEKEIVASGAHRLVAGQAVRPR